MLKIVRRSGSPAVRCLACLAAAFLAGCSGGGEPVMVQVPCSIAIDAADDVGPSYAAYGSGGGFVALPAGELHLGRLGAAGTEFEGLRFSKFGLLVRSDRAVSLEVAGSAGEAVLDYVHPDAPASVLRVGPCSAEREWVVFAGGVWVSEPGCVELVGASADERVPVSLRVGASCDASQNW